jgi:hypothetical protein
MDPGSRIHERDSLSVCSGLAESFSKVRRFNIVSSRRNHHINRKGNKMQFELNPVNMVSEAPFPPVHTAYSASIQAGNHIRCAAEIISNAMPGIPETDQQLYYSIVGALCTLERHLKELNHILETRNGTQTVIAPRAEKS